MNPLNSIPPSPAFSFIMEGKSIVRPVFDNPFLDIVETPGGSIKRDPEPRNPADADPDGTSPVLSKDVILDPNKNTWLRLYLPRQSKRSPSPTKLTVVFYYHGGGFVFCHADSTIYDVFCQGIVENLDVMVISLEYRLAPDHRLPAAYEDAIDGLHWIKTTQDEWVLDYADLKNIYLAGTSAGGNLAYNAGVIAAAAAKDLEPLKIKGLILHHPYFSGKKRTESEEKLANDWLLPLYAIDQMFDLSLPKGVDHDHAYSNPWANDGLKHVDRIKALGWRVLVTGCFDDPLVDAGLITAKILEARGVQTMKFFSDGYHAMEVFDHSMSGPLYAAMKKFVSFN